MQPDQHANANASLVPLNPIDQQTIHHANQNTADISPAQQARMTATFTAAYARADRIANGTQNPLTT